MLASDPPLYSAPTALGILSVFTWGVAPGFCISRLWRSPKLCRSLLTFRRIHFAIFFAQLGDLLHYKFGNLFVRAHMVPLYEILREIEYRPKVNANIFFTVP